MLKPDATSDPFVAKLQADGTHIWSKTFAAVGGNAWAGGVATDADGHVYVTGWHQANIQIDEMRRTFNCGVGMIAVVHADDVAAAIAALEAAGERAWLLGRIASGDDEVQYL